jgi:hypothetical protein
MSCTLVKPSDFRTDALNAGRVAEVYRGGSVVWRGKLDQANYGSGWAVTAHGTGTMATEWDAIYTTWTNQNDAVDQAIARGLPWANPSPKIPSSVFLGQQQDSGSLKLDALLQLMCSKGAQTWWVGRDAVLKVAAVPSVPTRLLVCTVPQARTLAGDYNALLLRYQVSADGAAAAVYATTFVTNAGSITQHGRMEDYDDLSNAGQMTAAAAQAIGTSALSKYQRATYAGPFSVGPGQLLTLGGQPVDIGMEPPGMVCQVILTDAGYGGEIAPGKLTFPVGRLEFDDDTDSGTVTPWAALSLQGLIGASMLGPDVAEVRRKAAAAAAKKAAAARAAAAKHRAVLAARREAAQDRAQLASWRRRHPHHRGPAPRF